jgi:SAM-dependent methyltransferase
MSTPIDHAERDKAHHDAIAQEYERVVNEPRRLANRALFASVRPYLPSARSAMLDLGCGTGQMCDRFAADFAQATGVDHSEPMLAIARRKSAGAKTLYLQADALSYLDQAGTHFDLITAVGFLHHLQHQACQDLLAKMRAHLQPGGRIVIAEPMDFDPNDEPGLLRWWNQPFRTHFRGYETHAEDPDEAPIPEATLRNWFDAAGLRVHYARRSWEIFPRYGAGFLDRCAISVLDKFCRRRGVVGLFVLG